ncbi:hypothetical protein SuNHUV7_20320 (plasmid) [Pseudoseohaeicola sp. NH-UV-7]|uniref:hypothetical protein n=1 Tax=Sulfitobacter sp. TBRI5 TaxID=2989732 RepID=UPI003A749908
MSVILLPRLGQIAVDQVLDDYFEDMKLSATLDMLRQTPGAMSYAASGGTPLKKEILIEIRNMLVGAAQANGFPSRGSTKERAQFDTDVAKLLGENPLFAPPEALRDDVWAFLTTVVAPDVVKWRFGTASRERYHGGVRNAFQRLWMRAWSLDRGMGEEDRWGLIRDLTEDAFGSIVERPSIAGDSRLALALAEGWVRMSERAGRGAMEAIMRRAVIAFRLQNQIQVLTALEDAELRAAVDLAFERARQSLTGVVSDNLGEEADQENDPSTLGLDTSAQEDVLPPPEAGVGQPFSRLRSFLGRGRKVSPEAARNVSQPRDARFGMRDTEDADSSNHQNGGRVNSEDAMSGREKPEKNPTAQPNEEAISEQLYEFFDEVSGDGLEEPGAVIDQQAFGKRDSESVSENASNDNQAARFMIGEMEYDQAGIVTYLDFVEKMAAERNWLSPKSREAIEKLKSGNFRLSATDRNSMENLRSKLSKIAVKLEIPRRVDVRKDAQLDTDSDELEVGQYKAGQTGPFAEGPDEIDGALIWNEITLPSGTDVRMSYRGKELYAEVSESKIVDQDGQYSPGSWANKVANDTSRNAWRDIWFRKPGEQSWVLADDLRRIVRRQQP